MPTDRARAAAAMEAWRPGTRARPTPTGASTAKPAGYRARPTAATIPPILMSARTSPAAVGRRTVTTSKRTSLTVTACPPRTTRSPRQSMRTTPPRRGRLLPDQNGASRRHPRARPACSGPIRSPDPREPRHWARTPGTTQSIPGRSPAAVTMTAAPPRAARAARSGSRSPHDGGLGHLDQSVEAPAPNHRTSPRSAGLGTGSGLGAGRPGSPSRSSHRPPAGNGAVRSGCGSGPRPRARGPRPGWRGRTGRPPRSGVNQRRSWSPSGRDTTKAVSDRLSSRATACMTASSGKASRTATAAGLPAKGRSVKASTTTSSSGMGARYRLGPSPGPMSRTPGLRSPGRPTTTGGPMPGADFDDTTDFDDARRGRVGALDRAWSRRPTAGWCGTTTPSPSSTGRCPPTANPSLWRQSQLTAMQGLFEVTDGIYQVRGLDLSNMTLVEVGPRGHRHRPAGLGRMRRRRAGPVPERTAGTGRSPG